MKPSLADDEPTQPIRVPVTAETAPVPAEPAPPSPSPTTRKKASFADSVWKLLQSSSLRPEEAETVRRAIKALDRSGEQSAGTLARGSRRVAFTDGELLVTAGEQSTDLYVLLEGAANVELGGIVVERLRVGEVFGEIGLLSGSPRAASVRAEGRVIALRIPAELIDERLREALWGFAAERRFNTASPLTDPDRRRVWYTSARMHRIEPGTWEIGSPWIFLALPDQRRVKGRESRQPDGSASAGGPAEAG